MVYFTIQVAEITSFLRHVLFVFVCGGSTPDASNHVSSARKPLQCRHVCTCNLFGFKGSQTLEKLSRNNETVLFSQYFRYRQRKYTSSGIGEKPVSTHLDQHLVP